MQFTLSEYTDVKTGKKTIKQVGEIYISKIEDYPFNYKVKLYGMEEIGEIKFKTAEETAYFLTTWKKLKRNKLDDKMKELAETIKTCKIEKPIEKPKKKSLKQRFEQWLINKIANLINGEEK